MTWRRAYRLTLRGDIANLDSCYYRTMYLLIIVQPFIQILEDPHCHIPNTLYTRR